MRLCFQCSTPASTDRHTLERTFYQLLKHLCIFLLNVIHNRNGQKPDSNQIQDSINQTIERTFIKSTSHGVIVPNQQKVAVALPVIEINNVKCRRS